MRFWFLLSLVVLFFFQITLANVCNHLHRQDCGYIGINQEQCEAKGCCWAEASDSSVPWCFYKVPEYDYYSVSKVQETASGYSISLNLNSVNNYTPFGSNIYQLQCDVTFESANRVHIKIYDPNNQRWEIPEEILPSPGIEKGFDRSKANYAFDFGGGGNGREAWFSIQRKSDGVVVFNTTQLQFADQFLQVSLMMPHDASGQGPFVYGLGEHVAPLLLNNGQPNQQVSFTMHNVDIPTPVMQNEYGHHPFFFQLLPSLGKSHGVWLRNANSMDVILYQHLLTYRTIGGVLDFYVFVGESPEQVIQQYQHTTGLPYMPPWWALGWHQSRYGIKNMQELKDIVSNYQRAGIPLDTLWSDIDYMEAYKDFTFDHVNFPADQMATFVKELHQQGQQYVVIVDPGIHNDDSYSTWRTGLEQDVYIKKNDNATVYIGEVWPGSTAFPNFWAPQTAEWWQREIEQFISKVEIDGLWIDMNEIANFVNGDCSTNNYVKPSFAYSGDVNNPPYAINNFNNRASLNVKKLGMDCVSVYQGTFTINSEPKKTLPQQSFLLQEYNVHNLYGLMEAIATNKALIKLRPSKRPFLLTRSSFSGSGKHTAIWGGDNHSTYKDMTYSISTILTFNFFGLLMSGVDACGFLGATTEALCGRWTALAAFSPFARNHNSLGEPDQYPYTWASTAAIAKRFFTVRYDLLNYFYTLFYQASVNGGTVVRPTFFEFPTDFAAATATENNNQYLIGSSILVSAFLSEDDSALLPVTFPVADWYDYFSGALEVPRSDAPKTVQYQCPLVDCTMKVHVRGGSIVVMQKQAQNSSVVPNAAFIKHQPFVIHVYLDTAAASASGDLYYDDGISQIPTTHLLTSFNFANGVFTNNIKENTLTQQQERKMPLLSLVVVHGAFVAPSAVVVNGQQLPVSCFAVDGNNKQLEVGCLQLSLTQAIKIQFLK